MDLFERATRKQYTFVTEAHGILMVSGLWQMSLPNLDKLAQSLHIEVERLSTGSFLRKSTDSAADPDNYADKLEIVKRVINVLETEHDEVQYKVERDEERRKLLDALMRKEDEELQSMDKEDILKKLAELD